MAIINWKNTAENLIIALIGVIAGVAIGYYVSVKAAEAMLDNQKEIIVEAIRKETTSIKNEFNTEIKKLKNRKGELTLDVKPVIENQIEQNGDTISVTQPPPEPKKKRGFLGRLFGKKNKN